MKTAAVLLLACSLGAPPLVLVRDAGPIGLDGGSHLASLEAAVASGTTTLIHSGGSSMEVANHVQVARYVAQRVAEELGNALVLPVMSDAPASPTSRRPARMVHPVTPTTV